MLYSILFEIYQEYPNEHYNIGQHICIHIVINCQGRFGPEMWAVGVRPGITFPSQSTQYNLGALHKHRTQRTVYIFIQFHKHTHTHCWRAHREHTLNRVRTSARVWVCVICALPAGERMSAADSSTIRIHWCGSAANLAIRLWYVHNCFFFIIRCCVAKLNFVSRIGNICWIEPY